MTMTNKVFEVASFAGDMLEHTVEDILTKMAVEEDNERVLTMNKRQLHKELAKQQRQLVNIANGWDLKDPKIRKQHEQMVARQRFIKFLIHPSAIQGDVSLRA